MSIACSLSLYIHSLLQYMYPLIIVIQDLHNNYTSGADLDKTEKPFNL